MDSKDAIERLARVEREAASLARELDKMKRMAQSAEVGDLVTAVCRIRVVGRLTIVAMMSNRHMPAHGRDGRDRCARQGRRAAAARQGLEHGAVGHSQGAARASAVRFGLHAPVEWASERAASFA